MGRFRKTRYFISGLMAGVLISALLMGGALYYSSRQDYVVMVNTHNLVHQVEDVAGVMLAEMLPQYMEEYRSKIPDLVSRQTGSPFADAKFQVGGVDFALPPDLVEELDRQYIDSLTQAVSDLLDSLPADKLGQELGQELGGVMEGSAYAQFNDQIIYLNLLDSLRIPLTIRLFSDPEQQNFRLLWRSGSLDSKYWLSTRR